MPITSLDGVELSTPKRYAAVTGLKPLSYEDPLYQLLRDGNIKQFNSREAPGYQCEFTHCDFRSADLCGIDLSSARLDGASINGAKIFRALFPTELTLAEITLSVVHGTRMHYKK